MKRLDELINVEEPAFELIQEWLKEATNHYEILPKEQRRAEKELIHLQITTRSPMGAVIYETGGILIDYGWLRILGSGSDKLDRGIYEWNLNKTILENQQPPFLLIADDVLGGFFAINGGVLGDDIGNIYYFPPDTLEWESLEINYSQFLYWVLTGDLSLFYSQFRWNNWMDDVMKINGNHGYSFMPFLWTKEGKDIEKVFKREVPIEEIYSLVLEKFNLIEK
ncbi:DUF2625 domain-containing protein [Mannheimia haemolytica]|nr:DUF2625 domain-containing protein [Mannheimia haemolytica]STY62188.1 Protein of uncharacterised function DUF2625 [Mannheimia haemolytica]